MRQVICLGRGPVDHLREKSAARSVGTTVKTIPLSWIIVPALTLILLTPAQAAETRQLTGHVPAAIAKLNLQPLGVPASTNRLHLAIGLPLRNHAELDALLEQIGDPTSPNFRHYLSPEQFYRPVWSNRKRLRSARLLRQRPRRLHRERPALEPRSSQRHRLRGRYRESAPRENADVPSPPRKRAHSMRRTPSRRFPRGFQSSASAVSAITPNRSPASRFPQSASNNPSRTAALVPAVCIWETISARLMCRALP